MNEGIPKEPATAEEWENEVYLTKVRDRLVWLRNRNTKFFIEALALVAESHEFTSYGPQLEVFVSRKSEDAKRFIEALGSDIDLVTSKEYVSPEQFMERSI
jgi:hypothetical protein